ncbi:hypothetical protein GMD78_02805 [Ornithinibacillus sp. L9]|uniref:Pre-toxin TG domain-containing protein n=1 Tax=Ornithinibacillus caprae TaxID=2678566 RepID=A0A6N8FCQ0_9BACI|nr:hypothetical protein [Ornithinibacillus caprae]MUK87330.1 hypothetical protein [Ornithinibacillus caprae]
MKNNYEKLIKEGKAPEGSTYLESTTKSYVNGEEITNRIHSTGVLNEHQMLGPITSTSAYRAKEDVQRNSSYATLAAHRNGPMPVMDSFNSAQGNVKKNGVLQKAGSIVKGVADFLFLDDIKTLTSQDTSLLEKGMAAANFFPIGKVVKGAKLGYNVISNSQVIGKVTEGVKKGWNKAKNAAKTVTDKTSKAIKSGANGIKNAWNKLFGKGDSNKAKDVKDAVEGKDNIGWSMPQGGGTINGRKYSEHALERMAPNTPEVRAELTTRAHQRATQQGLKPGTKEYNDFMKKQVDPRGITPSVVEDTIKYGTPSPGNTPGTTVYQRDQIRVVTNSNGDVITVIPR